MRDCANLDVGVVDGYQLAPPIPNSQQIQHRGGAHCGHESHDDHHGEKRGGEGADVVGDVEDDEFDEAAGVEQGSEGDGVAPGLARPAGGDGGASHLAEDGGGEDDPGPDPHGGVVEQVEAGPHAGEGEKEREQEDRDDQVEALADGDLPVFDSREADTGEKGPEERVNADFVGGGRGEEDAGDDKAEESDGQLGVVATEDQPGSERADDADHDEEVDEQTG